MIQTIEQKVKQFSIATGISCMYMLMDDTSDQQEVRCSFCKTISKATGNPVHCHESILYGAYQSERFGGKYIFYCPMGLVHFASPIFYDGKLFAVAVGGPALLISKDEFIFEDIVDKMEIDDNYTNRLREDLEVIPEFAPEKVTALSEILFSVCSSISGANTLQLLNDEEAIGNDMSKYINLISTMGGSSTDSYPIEKEKELLSLISSGDKEKAQLLLDDVLREVIAYSNNDFEKVKARVLELIVLLSRAALEGGADPEQIFGLNFKFINQINAYKTAEELANWLSNIMVRFTDSVFIIVNVRHIDTIYKSIDYIKRNYAKKLTLEEVAGNVYLSPSYFSKLFKEGLNISFNNYLNKVRIDNSKRLLLNSKIELIDIPALTGFEDQSYFSKVFKKMTGVTPIKYRQRQGK